MFKSHEQWMELALQQAQAAGKLGEVPVGAIVICEDELLASGFNQPISSHDPTAHAEIVALRAAAIVKGNYRLPGCSVYVTIEPCTMCVGALLHARIDQLIFGALEPRAGAIVSREQLLDGDYHNHQIYHRGGVLEHQCGAIMQEFFKARRK